MGPLSSKIDLLYNIKVINLKSTRELILPRFYDPVCHFQVQILQIIGLPKKTKTVYYKIAIENESIWK